MYHGLSFVSEHGDIMHTEDVKMIEPGQKRDHFTRRQLKAQEEQDHNFLLQRFLT